MPTTPDKFHLPPDVSFRKERLSYGWAYVFRHTQLGNLGRIVLQGRPDGRTHLTCEVAGDPADPMTAKRAAIFQPLGLELASKFDKATGGTGKVDVPWVEPPPRPPEPKKGVASKLMPCETCEAGVALLIFAEQATDPGGLEDLRAPDVSPDRGTRSAHLGDGSNGWPWAASGATGQHSESLAGARAGTADASG